MRQAFLKDNKYNSLKTLKCHKQIFDPIQLVVFFSCKEAVLTNLITTEGQIIMQFLFSDTFQTLFLFLGTYK